MVRPESCTDLAGESPVRAKAGEPGSRPQSGEEIPRATAGRQKSDLSGKQRSGPQHKVNAAASLHYQPKGDREGRAAHITAKAEDKSRQEPEREWTSPGYWWRHALKGMCGTGETLPGGRSLAKARGIRRRAEIQGSWEGVRGVRSTCEGGQNKPLEGRDPASVMAEEGKREGMDRASGPNYPALQSARTLYQPMGACRAASAVHAAPGRPSVSRVLENCMHGLKGGHWKPDQFVWTPAPEFYQ